jgi:hypothetical protein
MTKGYEKYYKHIVFKTAGSEYTYIFCIFQGLLLQKNLTTDLFFIKNIYPLPPKISYGLSRRFRFKWS